MAFWLIVQKESLFLAVYIKTLKPNTANKNVMSSDVWWTLQSLLIHLKIIKALTNAINVLVSINTYEWLKQPVVNLRLYTDTVLFKLHN